MCGFSKTLYGNELRRCSQKTKWALSSTSLLLFEGGINACIHDVSTHLSVVEWYVPLLWAEDLPLTLLPSKGDSNESSNSFMAPTVRISSQTTMMTTD